MKKGNLKRGKKYKPITKLDGFIHGGDYSPEQWLDHPEILDEDIRLMKLAGCNAMTIGIFSWVSYEPSEGVYTFDVERRIATGINDKLFYGSVSFERQINT